MLWGSEFIYYACTFLYTESFPLPKIIRIVLEISHFIPDPLGKRTPSKIPTQLLFLLLLTTDWPRYTWVILLLQGRRNVFNSGGGGGGGGGTVAEWAKIFWGAQSLRGSVATEGGGVGGGCPTVGSFFIIRLENVQSGAYLRRKFRLGDTNINKSLVWK